MKLLLTGARGHLGTNFVNLCASSFELVVCVDKGSSQSNDKIILPNVVWVDADLLSVDIIGLLRDYHVDHIVHTSADTHVDKSYLSPIEFIDNNVKVTVLLLEAMHRMRDAHGIDIRMIHMSTDEVYGPSDTPLTENVDLHPTNPYSASKASAEMMIRAYISSYALSVVILRPNNMAGMWQPEKVIQTFTYRLLDGLKIQIHGTGQQVRDYISTDELCSVICSLIHSNHTGVFNIGCHNGISVNELASKIIHRVHQRCGILGLVEHVADRPYNDSRYCIDTTRLTSVGISINDVVWNRFDDIVDHYIDKWMSERLLV